MSRQWGIVLVVVGGLVLGIVALIRFGSAIQPVGVGSAAPDFRAVDLGTGDSVSLGEQYAGAVTLVNIWATWCPPCRKEMPAMQQVYAALAAEGFKIAAVSVDADIEDIRAFAREFQLSFDLLHDRSGRVQQLYQAPYLPESFLLDRQGVIVKRISGEYNWNSPTNRALIKRLLAEPVR